MELFIFARFRARVGEEGAVAAAPRDVLGPTRVEPGRLGIGRFRSTRDPRLLTVLARWIDEAAFERRPGLPHTVRFVKRIEKPTSRPIDVTRARKLTEGRAPKRGRRARRFLRARAASRIPGPATGRPERSSAW